MFTTPHTRRVVAGLAAAGAVVLALTGCAGGSGGDDAPVSEITVVAANSPWVEGVKTLATKYKDETGITVNIEAYGNEQLNDNYKVKLNASSADFDVMAFQVQDVMREFSRNGWLADMTDYVASDAAWNWEDFQPAARDAVQLDGTVYGVPVMTERQIVYYRADLLQAAGMPVPETLDELESAVAALHDPDAGMYGIAMRGSRVPLVTQLSSFLYSYGADFQDADGNASVDTPEAVEAIEFYGDLLSNYGPPGVTNMGWVEASALFAQGKAAFYIDADSQAYTFLDASKSSVVDTVGFAQFPAGPAGSHFYNIVPQTVGINEFSTKKDAAWDFIKWVTNEENTTWLLANETVPGARQSAWADDAAVASFPAGLVDIVRDVADHGVGHDRPRLEQVAAAREIVGGPVITAIEGGDVAEAAASANSQFQDLLDSEK
ncbi:sugar ABC transporter substrate-binding protein [Microbacterium enclense]|uniref:Sugar ABC transporter substrate-binding protein n=1 Tax=Microbacterium enclense TaxID=993073 RepID=A0A3S4LVW4_9MICO|nr:sugar ABC transporter substrate-binding protein [Microbacterium enclense]RWR16678.1 sugar ABC transporter substrate-binding protein [Microbacterium enclense]